MKNISPELSTYIRHILCFQWWLLATSISAQGQALSGKLLDRQTHQPVSTATLSISSEAHPQGIYTLSKSDGSFRFETLLPENWRLVISASGYVPRQLELRYDTGKIELGAVSLQRKSDTLVAATVIAKVPAGLLRGDTLEFNAARVKMRENAAVSELLAQLPGLRMEADGSLTFNGQKLDKIMVDGQDLLSSTPSAAIRSLTADMIAKVQLVDKRSTQSELSGTDDGTRSKALNLVLNEEGRHRTIQKIQAAGDPQGYFESSLVDASFQGNRQLVGMVLASNTGNTQVNTSVDDQTSGLSIPGLASDPLGATAGTGIPTVAMAGIHFANPRSESKFSLDANGQAGALSTQATSDNATQEELPTTSYLTQQHNVSTNRQSQHQANGMFRYKPDSANLLQLYFQESGSYSRNTMISTGSSYLNDSLANFSERSIRDHADNEDCWIQTSWRHTFARKGRNLAIGIGTHQNSVTGNGLLHSSISYPGGSAGPFDTLVQSKNISNRTAHYFGSLNYSEPLTTHLSLISSYSLEVATTSSIVQTFNGSDPHSNLLVDSLSSQYQNKIFEQRGSTGLQAQLPRLTLTASWEMQDYRLDEQDTLPSYLLDHRYTMLSPKIFGRYNIGLTDMIGVYFGSFLVLPSPAQMQPVTNNNDPLHIYKGNPSLRSGNGRNFSSHWTRTKPFLLSVNLSYNCTSTDIGTQQIVDDSGRQYSQPVNIPGTKNLVSNISIAKKIKLLDAQVGIYAGYALTSSYTLVNTLLDQLHTVTESLGVSLVKATDKYGVELRWDGTYSENNSRLNKLADTRLFQYQFFSRDHLFIRPNFELLTSLSYQWRQKATPIDGQNSTKICGLGAKKYYCHNLLVIGWRVEDILNQHNGISRSISPNQISESKFNIVGRHWMVSLSYQFPNKR